MTKWWQRIKQVLMAPASVTLLPRSAGYCEKSLSHRHCVAKDPDISDICLLCGMLGIGVKNG